jgi:PAS domain S-box-containing protein
MTSVVPVALGVVAGISLCAGFHHLFSGLSRQREVVSLSFALMGLLLFAYALIGITTYTALSVSDYVIGTKWQLALLLLFAPAFVWFTTTYAGLESRHFSLLMSGFFLVILVIHVVSPFGVLYSEIEGIRALSLPWGERYAFPNATPSPWGMLIYLALAFAIGYVAYACYRQYRRGEKRPALILGVSMAVFLGTAVYDAFINLGIISSIYLLPFGFLALVVVMSLELSGRASKASSLMQESDEHFRLLFEKAPIGMAILTLDAELIRVNEAMCHTLGYPAEELVGRSIMSFTHPEDVAPNLAMDEKVLRGEISSFQMEKRYIHKNGSIIWALLQVGLLHDPQGRPYRFVGQVIDITEQKQAATELGEHRERLEELVEERTNQLSKANELLRREVLERERARAQISHRNMELLTLQVAGTAIASSLDVRKTMDTVAEQMINLLGVDGCTVSDWHRERNVVSVIAESSPEHWYDKEASLLDYYVDDYPMTKRVLERGEVVQMVASQPDIDGAELAIMRAAGIKSLLMLPLIHKGETLGLVELSDSKVERHFTENQISLSMLLANQAASAIQNARLFKHAEKELAERKRAEAALKESESKLSGIVNSAMDAIITVDDDQKIVLFNPAAEQMFGHDSAEAVGCPLDRLMPKRFQSEHAEHIGSFGQTNVAARRMGLLGTVWGTRSNGEEFPLEASISRIELSDKNYYTAILRDVTARKEAEDAVARRVQELSTLNRIAETVATVTELPAAMEIVTEIVTGLFVARSTAIYIVEDDQLKLISRFDQQGGFPESIGQLIPIAEMPGAREILDHKIPLVLADVQSLRLPPGVAERLLALNIQATMIVPLRARGKVIGMMSVGFDQPDRSLTPAEVKLAETVAGYVTGAIETARLLEEEQRQRQMAESLREVATAVTSSLDQQEVLAAIFEQLRNVMPYDGACISLIDGESLLLSKGVGISNRYLERRIPLNDGSPLVRVINSNEANAIADTEHSSEWQRWEKDGAIRSWMGAPLATGEGTIGLLTVDSSRPGAYADEDVQILQTFADQAAIAIENARLYERAQTVAIDEERQRLARELHDSVTQSLYSLTLLSKGWGALAEQGRLVDVASCFNQLGEVSQQALKEMRLLIHQLRPPILEEVGIVGALQKRLDAVEQRVSVKTRLLTNGNVGALPHNIEDQLFHIAQEALNNALRHAAATAITIRVQEENGRVSLSVHDNGIGFDPNAVTAGMGLVNMRERAEAIGGQMAISVAPARGTTVNVSVAGEPAIGVRR